MLLYHAYHPGTLTQVLIHRLTVNRKEDAILLVGNKDLMGDIYGKLNEFIDNGFFSKIIYCNECYGLFETDAEKCERDILQYFDQIFTDARLKIEDFTNVYTGVDTLHSFGVYLAMKKINYFFFGMSLDFFAIAQKRVDILDSKMKVYASVMTKYGASNGTGVYATRVVYPNSQYNINENPNVVEFDFKNMIYKIAEDDKKKLILIYGITEDLTFDTSVTMIITCSQWLLRNFPDVKRQAGIMYQILADYYIPADAKLVIKPHPLTRFKTEDFKKFFDVTVFPECFPSNFLPLFRGLNIKETYTTTSNGTIALNESIQNHRLGATFVSHYNKVIGLHFCISLFFFLLKNSHIKLFNYGISNELISNLLSISFKQCVDFNWLNLSQIDDGSYGIIDNIKWNKGNYEERYKKTINSMYGDYILTFLNTDDSFFFLKDFNSNVYDNFICVKLYKSANKINILNSLCTDTLFIYCPNYKTRETIRSFSYKKNNKYSGFDIYASILSEEDTQKEITKLFLLKKL